MVPQNEGAYAFLLETFETEVLKITGIWGAFPDEALNFRPSSKSRTVLEQMEHQVQSEGRWMTTMLGVDTGNFKPQADTTAAYVAKYSSDAARRLEILRTKPDAWWQEDTNFFDVVRSRAWVMMRRINHSAHHRGQLIVYLRMLGLRIPSVYGPTADTGGKVLYHF